MSQGLSAESLRRWRRKEKEKLVAAKSSLTLVPVSAGRLDSDYAALAVGKSICRVAAFLC